MAQQVTVSFGWKTIAAIAAGFLTLSSAVTTAIFHLDNHIEEVHHRVEGRATLAALCSKGDTGDEVIDQARDDLVATLGGCP